MALLKFGSLCTSGSGSVGGHMIQNSRGGIQLRNKPIPRGLASDSQRAVRNINPVLQAGWKALTNAQRQIWNNYAQPPLCGHDVWMKYQYQRIFENLPFLSSPTKKLTTYLGPELIDQVNWVNAWYWNAAFAANWSTDGIKLSSDGGNGFAANVLFSIPNHFYQIKVNITGTGELRIGSELPYRYGYIAPRYIIRNTLVGHQFFEMWSINFNGSVTSISVKEIFNFY